MEGLILQGVELETFYSRMGEIVDAKVQEALDRALPKESPNDLLTYDEILKVYNMATKDYVSKKINDARVQVFSKDGRLAITRASAEELFRKTKN